METRHHGKKALWLPAWLLVGCLSLAQSPEYKEKDSLPPFETVDPDGYIVSYDKALGLSPILDLRTISLDFTSADKRAEYVPNKNFSFGFSLLYKWIALSPSFNLFGTDSERGKTNSFYFDIRLFPSQKISTQIRLGAVSGFYLFDYNGFDPAAYPVPFDTIRGDLFSAELTLGVFYIPNGHRYSFKTLFNNPLEFQKKSAGSLIANLGWSLDEVTAGRPFFPDFSNQKNGLGEIAISTNTLLGRVGYGYNFVTLKGLTLSALALAGPTYVWSDSSGGKYSTIGYSYNLLLSIRYNTPRSQIELSTSTDRRSYSSKNEGTATTLTNSYIGLSYTYRFDLRKSKFFDGVERVVLFKFLKKRKPAARP